MSNTTTHQTKQSATASLRNVVDQVETFLLDQVQRIEQELNDVAQLESPSSVVQLPIEVGTEIDAVSDFETTKSQWEREYATQRSELEEDCQRLAEAWERVENEQRQLLAARSIQQNVGHPVAASSEGTTDLRNKTPDSLKPVNGVSRKSSTPRDPTSITFKQLQQQIRAHNKRRK